MDTPRVLFVDDEEELVQTVVERLNIRGIEARGATSGIEALSRIDQRDYDVVIVDVRMPGIGGLDVLRQLRHSHPDLKVILLSGHGSTENVDDGLRLGAFDYLQKPVDIKVLVQIIQKAAGGDRHRKREDS
jgi:DNA-binding NtrC family response regulator